MAKYLKTSFARDLEIQVMNKEISYNKMLELIQEEVIKKYKEDKNPLRKIKEYFQKFNIFNKE